MSWKARAIQDLSGKTVVITGSNSGLGLASSHALAAKGAHVIMTARDEQRGWAAKAKVEHAIPGASVEVRRLDTSSLESVRSFAKDFSGPLDILLNNAGIMAIPFSQSVDGYEMHLATNHLGHFAWTAHLWPLLVESEARVVAVSSLAHTQAKGIDLRSLTTEGSPRRYRRWVSYAESKLADLLFSQELDRRTKAAGVPVTSVAAHPGFAATNLQRTGIGMGSPLAGTAVMQASKLVSQSAEKGAWPLLRAATDPTCTGGEYVGPAGLGGTRGRPVLVGMTRWARDEVLASNLWTASELATGVDFPVARPA